VLFRSTINDDFHWIKHMLNVR